MSLNVAARASVKLCPPQREGANPHAPPLGDDQVRRRRPDVEEDSPGRLRREPEVERHGVVHRDRAEGEDVGRQPLLAVLRQEFRDLGLGDREDADLDIRAVIAREGLIVPFDVLDGERNLLHRLEPDEVGNSLLFHGRQLGEARERAVPWD